MIMYKFFGNLVFLSLIIFNMEVHGDSTSSVNCTGTACAALPDSYKTQINELPSQLQSQYLSKVLENMNGSAASVNSISSLQGMGSINKFQIGLGMSASGSQQESIDFKYRDIAFKDLPNVGFGVSPNLMLGFNLGWLLGQGPRDADDVNDRSILHRINFYFSGFSVNTNTADSKGSVPSTFEYTGKLSMSQTGMGVRMDLVQPGDSIFIRFLGVNAGIGIRKQNFAFELEDTKSANANFTLGTLTGTWISQTQFDYSTKAYSVPMDVRTGFQIFRFISIFGGMGVSKSTAESRMSIYRDGPVKFSADASTAALYSTATTSTVTNEDRLAGNLNMSLSESSKKSYSQSYALVGFEIDVWKLKILAEAYAMDKIQAASVGVKIDL
jgi:hypothetical protein